MRGVYEASYKISALNSARTLMLLTAPADGIVEILQATITNCSNETNEQLEAVLQTVDTLGTPTDTPVTPGKREAGDAASGSTVTANVTASEPSFVAGTEVGREGFASLAGYRFQPVPEERPIVAPGETIALKMLSAPTAFDCIVSLVFREVG